jgi:hypothetical protein
VLRSEEALDAAAVGGLPWMSDDDRAATLASLQAQAGVELEVEGISLGDFRAEMTGRRVRGG